MGKKIEKMRMVIIRNAVNSKQTEGTMLVFRGRDLMFQCVCLELGDNFNKRRKSRIPEGHYKCVKHKSPRFGPAIWVKDVPGRSEILIHFGNYNMDTLGCILPGRKFIDMNTDGFVDVTSSRHTMADLLRECDHEFQLCIIDEPVYS